MDNMDEIRDRFEPLIEDRGLRVTARETEVSHAAIRRWLDGNASLSFERVQKLAAVLGFTLTVKYELKRSRNQPRTTGTATSAKPRKET